MMDDKDKKIKELEDEITRLKKVEQDYKKVEQDYKKVEQDYKKVEQDYKKVEQDYKHLKKEFEEFKAKYAGTVQNLQKALRIKPDLPQSPNPIGAKPRHKGHGRKSPTNFDREEPLTLDVCSHCNTSLKGKTVSTRERFVITIHIINPA